MLVSVSEIESCALEHALSEFEHKTDGSPLYLSTAHRRLAQGLLVRLRDQMARADGREPPAKAGGE